MVPAEARRKLESAAALVLAAALLACGPESPEPAPVALTDRVAHASGDVAGVSPSEPVDPAALAKQGRLLVRSEDERPRGIALLEGALRAAPTDPDLLHALGFGYWKTGRVSDGIDLMQRALRATPPKTTARALRSRELAAARAQLARGRASASAPNVLLVVIDTLRADHLGAYGYARDTSPKLDALAAEGVLFERATSQAPWTAASVASLLTGLYPSAHGLDGGIEWGPGQSAAGGTLPFAVQRTLGVAHSTLAEILHRNGFATAAFVSNVYMNSVFGFSQGFEVYDDRHRGYSRDQVRAKRRSRATNRLAFEWIAEGPAEPFFLMVHYNDPHWPYNAPAPHRERFVEDYQGALTPETAVARVFRDVEKLSPEDLAYLVALYDGEIRAVDSSLADLLSKIRAAGFDRDLVTVVTSDHGEEFLDHGGMNHGFTLYEEQLHVPLVFHAPERLRPHRVGSVVELIDVLPTLLDLVGVAERPPHLQGESLLGLLRGDDPFAPSEALSEAAYEGRLRSLRGDSWKLIQEGEDDQQRFFDLKADPGERVDSSDRVPGEVVEAMQEELATRAAASREVRAALAPGSAPADVVLDEGMQQQLRSLGYID